MDAVWAFVFAASVAWMLVPAAESIARRIGAMDMPSERGLHDLPTPKLGGLAILVAVLAAGAIWLPWDAETRSILGGAAVITLLGVIDDVRELPALPKLLGQIGAALIPVVLGDVRVDVHHAPVRRRLRVRLGLLPADRVRDRRGRSTSSTSSTGSTGSPRGSARSRRGPSP